jgi:hypothetical protein
MSKKQRLILISVVLVVSVWFGFRGIFQQQHARQVIKECNAAADALEKSPPGFERADAFVQRLRAIDTSATPADLAKAIHDYADAMDRAIEAVKNGKESKQLNDEMAAARERFVTVMKNYL